MSVKLDKYNRPYVLETLACPYCGLSDYERVVYFADCGHRGTNLRLERPDVDTKARIGRNSSPSKDTL